MKKCSIIILNYKTGEHVEKLLDSIRSYLNPGEFEIIVADNNSGDEHLRSITGAYGFVKFLFLDSNDGFASGNNRAAAHAGCEYLLFLNPDVILKDDSVNRLLEYLKGEPDCGLVSGLLENENGDVIYCFNDYPGFEWELYQMLGAGYDSKISKILMRREIKTGESFEVDWFHGAFLMMRKSDFSAAGGFNEKYFMYYEDVELCYKIKRILGKKIVCQPDVRVIHDTRASIKNDGGDNLYTFHINRGKIIFFGNYSFLRRNFLLAVSATGILIRIALLPFWGKYKGARKSKLKQLLKVLKLYLNRRYLSESKYEYISK